MAYNELRQLSGLYRRKFRPKGIGYDPYDILASREATQEAKRRFDVGIDLDKDIADKNLKFIEDEAAARAEADRLARADALDAAEELKDLATLGLIPPAVNVALKIPGVSGALKSAGSSVYNSLKGIVTPPPTPVVAPTPILGPEATVGELGASTAVTAIDASLYAPIAEDVLAGGAMADTALASEAAGAGGAAGGGVLGSISAALANPLVGATAALVAPYLLNKALTPVMHGLDDVIFGGMDAIFGGDYDGPSSFELLAPDAQTAKSVAGTDQLKKYAYELAHGINTYVYSKHGTSSPYDLWYEDYWGPLDDAIPTEKEYEDVLMRLNPQINVETARAYGYDPVYVARYGGSSNDPMLQNLLGGYDPSPPD